MSRKVLNNCLTYLKEQYPLPQEVSVSFKFENSPTVKSVGGMWGSGNFSLKGSQKAEVSVAMKNRPLNEMVKTLAHEYKHAHQVFVEGMKVDPAYTGKFEREAGEFSQKMLPLLMTKFGGG